MPPALRAFLALTLTCCASPPPISAAPVPDSPGPAPGPTVVASALASAAISPTAPPASARPAPPAASSSGSFQPLTEDESRRLVVPHLAGATLAHPAFRGPFGPSSQAIVAITTTADAPPARFGGVVVLPDGRVLELPPLHDHWSGWEVHAVMFEDVDGDGVKELIVLAEYITGIGPEAAVPFFFNAVVRWDGSAFGRLPAVEKRLARATDAAGVRKALGARPRGR